MLKNKIVFDSHIVEETSNSKRNLGKHKQSMELKLTKLKFHNADGKENGKYYQIIWSIPRLNREEVIGIITEKNRLVDYDGVFELPKEAVRLLRKNNIVVPREFTER